MRKIKFRAWSKEVKKMFYSVWLNSDGKVEHAYNVDNNHHVINKPGTFTEEDCIPMQFTGLTDRKGVEIYEGDLLFNNGHEPGLVRFEKGRFGVGEFLVDLYKYSGDAKEVIGNIYEHPHLLKGEKI